jgi:hypothetical protein
MDIVDFTGTPPTVAANAGNPHGWNGKFQPLSLFQGGLALTVADLTAQWAGSVAMPVCDHGATRWKSAVVKILARPIRHRLCTR